MGYLTITRGKSPVNPKTTKDEYLPRTSRKEEILRNILVPSSAIEGENRSPVANPLELPRQ